MSVFNARIILRKGTEEDFNNSSADSYEVGELIFLDDVGKLLIKKADGQFVCVDPNELKNYLSKKEGNALFAELKDDIENSQFIDDFEYNSETGELKFFSGNDQVGDTVTLAISSGQQGLAFNGGYVNEENKLVFTQDGIAVEGIDPITLPAGGGGGGSDGSRIIFSLTSATSFSVADTAIEANVSFNFTSTDTATGNSTGNGTLQIVVGGVTKRTQSISQGSNTLNVMNYLKTGTNTVKLIITDAYNSTATRTCTINREALTLSWNLEPTIKNEGSLTVQLTPTGIGEKTIYVKVDDRQPTTDTVTTSGRRLSKIISGLGHGEHNIEAWCVMTVNGTELRSNTLTCSVAQVASGNSVPVIAANMSDVVAEQYTSFTIPHRVVDNAHNPTTVMYKVNGTTIQTKTDVDQSEQEWTYTPTTTGELVLAIQCETTTWTKTLTVTGLSVPVEEISDSLAYKLNPSAITTLDGITLSENFDTANGGLITDSEGVRCLRVMKGDRATINITPFADDAKRNGKEIKIVYKVENCSDFNATAINCMHQGIGFTVKANEVILSSEQQTLSMMTCEDVKSEMDFLIQSNSDKRLMAICEDSVPGKMVQYANGDSFIQSTQQKIVIGSDDCTVSVYLIRYYNSELDFSDIYANYLFDGKNATEIQQRYNESLIYDGQGNISPEMVADARPNLHVLVWQGSDISTSKTNVVTGDLRHIYTAGGLQHNWTAYGVEDKGQGTSSARYGMAGLNHDFKLKNGITLEDTTTANGYSMTEDSIPVNYFNFKDNVASLEHINNILLAEWYNRFNPFKRAARLANAKVRDTVEGHMAVLFYQNTGSTPVTAGAMTVAPGQTALYGVGCLNNSKKNYAVFGHDDEREIAVIEVNNNTSNQCLFKSDDLTDETWNDDGSFQFRYLSEQADEDFIKSEWQRLLSFVVSCNPDTATDATLDSVVTYGNTPYRTDSASYRRAKFKAEAGNYMEMDSVIYHYLFTTVFCMPDNRAKNTFWAYDAVTRKWNLSLGYDFDTAMGNDNEGKLALRYGYLDTDTLGSRDVFNAADSVLFCLTRDACDDDVRDKYSELEDMGAWNLDEFADLCDSYQSMVGNALFIEDVKRKVLLPLEQNDSSFVQMSNAKKRLQRRQFLKFQKQFISSYFKDDFNKSSIATIRGYTPRDWQGVEPRCEFTITPYCDCFINIEAGSEPKQVRAYAGQPATLTFDRIGALNNTEIYIYNAQYIQDIGDISCVYPGYISLAALTRLKNCVIGSSAIGYSNTNLSDVDVSNCTALEKLNVENCPNLNKALDLSNNLSLKELYTRGSSVTGVNFASGGKLHTALLNEVTSITARKLFYIQRFELADAVNLTSLVVENSPSFNTQEIVETAINLKNIRMLDVDWTLPHSTFIVKLSTLKGIDDDGYSIDTPVLTGWVTFEGIAQSKEQIIREAFPNLNIVIEHYLPEYTVRFMQEAGSDVVIESQLVEEGTSAIAPENNPTKEPTVSTQYTFAGWDRSLENITANTDINATWSEGTRVYVVSWYNGTALLQEDRVLYGGSSTYNGAALSRKGYVWSGWDKLANFIESDLRINAKFDKVELPLAKPSGYSYLYSDDPDDNSAYTFGQLLAINIYRQADLFTSPGDKIKITLPATRTVYTGDRYLEFNLSAVDHYRLENGGEKNAPHDEGDYSAFTHMSFFQYDYVHNVTRRMNATNTNVGGYNSSELQSFYDDQLFNELPLWWKAVIAPVQLSTTVGDSLPNIVTGIHKLVPALYYEVWGSGDFYLNEVDSGAKTKAFTYFRRNKGVYYFLGSPASGSGSAFCGVIDYGHANTYGATTALSLVFGFSLVTSLEST